MMPGRSGGSATAVFVAVSVILLFGGMIAATGMLGPASIPIWMAGMAATAVVFRGPVGRAIAARISGEIPGASGSELQAVADHTYAELDELRGRLLEVEERLDFTERMLAQRSADPVGQEGQQDAGH